MGSLAEAGRVGRRLSLPALSKHALELVCVLSVAIGCVACLALVALEWWRSQP